MENKYYLALDTETGGIGNEYSLLTLYAAILDSEFNILYEIDLSLKPDDGIYKICSEAMAINKIDIINHDKLASTYKEAKRILGSFLYEKTPKGAKLIPIGHNIDGDIRQIWDKLISPASWDVWVSYRKLDTGTIGRFLQLTGIIPKMSGSLESYAKHFGIEYIPHNAKEDTTTTIAILKKMIEIVK